MAMFYVYCRNLGKPSVIHNCLESALAEAQRLSYKEMQVFEVLQIVATVKPNVVCEVEFNV